MILPDLIPPPPSPAFLPHVNQVEDDGVEVPDGAQEGAVLGGVAVGDGAPVAEEGTVAEAELVVIQVEVVVEEEDLLQGAEVGFVDAGGVAVVLVGVAVVLVSVAVVLAVAVVLGTVAIVLDDVAVVPVNAAALLDDAVLPDGTFKLMSVTNS